MEISSARLRTVVVALAALMVFAGTLGYGRAAALRSMLAAAPSGWVAEAARPSDSNPSGISAPRPPAGAGASANAQAHPAAPPPDPFGASYGSLYVWPVTAPISSTFGPRWGAFHYGLDLAANLGVPIRAARSGVVLTAGTITDFGNAVILKHADGTQTIYGHASVLYVKAGQTVKQGAVIGLVGSTGRSTGPHLHFEIRVNGKAKDPLQYLPKR